MILSDTSIRRPVLTSMVAAALVLFGLLSFSRLSVRELPDVDPPIVSVSVFLRGANPRVMETTVTDILEEELSTLPGVRTLTSTSGEQNSNITIEFTLDRDLELAAQDVRDKVARVRGRLPQDILEPVVAKQEADAQPFMWMAVAGENYDLLQLSDIADRVVKRRLQTLPGVGRAQIAGERRYSMRVWLETRELAARGLTVQDVVAAIRTRNVEVPAGRIESERREFSVRSLGELKTPDEFGALVVSSANGQVVRLRDLGRVELGAENDRWSLRYNGQSAVAIGVVRQSKANLIEVSDAVRAEIPEIEATLPPGVSINIGFDQALFVRRSIEEAEQTLILAGILVVGIIFVFLRNLRATIIPGLAIPTSITAAFAVLYALGFTINNFTLLALILGIGIVVDDAIIVMENAYRHQEELGEDPVAAATKGTREIAFAVIATTVALVAVFTPLAFLQGTAGRLFNEFGIALAGAVIVSSFVALTLTPMLSARILKVPSSHGKIFLLFEHTFEGIARLYQKTLAVAIHHRAFVVAGGVASVLLAVFVFTRLEREFLPPEDRGAIVTFLVAPEGSSLEYTEGYQRQADEILAGVPEVTSYFSITGFFGGVNNGIIFARLADWSERDRSVDEILAEIRPKLMTIPGLFAFASAPAAIGFGSPVNYVVKHPDFDSLAVAMDRMVGRARQIPGLINVDTNLRVNKPELTVSYDRDRAEDAGVAISEISNALQALLGGQRVSTFTRENKLYDVIVQLEPSERATPDDMSAIYLRGRQGTLVSLDAVAHVEEGIGPRQLNHFDRVPSFTLTAALQPGLTLGQAIDSLDVVAAEVLPPGSATALAGESRELEESGNALYFAFVLALVVVYMVLAAQFESLVHPFTVLLAVPLAVTGALVTLLLAGSTLNLFSQIGMILLIGIVTKNSILLVEYANQLKGRGLDSVEAMLEAGRIRLRPILMTSVATIFALIPIALGLGAGAASRRPLGYAVVGGLIFSTALTLYLVPSVYTLFDALGERLRGRKTAADKVERLGTLEAGAS
ncbi:MAG: efflux RND transporter permease subunit [Candidatus Palauibacterales bacterium]|nr:efflux RND transporter permease subunit [Candidatus Palauibacterales bacterium]